MLWLTTCHAWAQAQTRVVLVKPQAGTRFANEILARLRGELSASELELEEVDAPEGATPKEAVQGEYHEPEPDLVLLVEEQRVGARRTEQIWLSDRMARRLFLQRVNADPSEPARSARWVAVQAAELVRARIADSAFQHPTPERPEPAAPPPLIVSRTTRETRVSVGLGISVLHGFSGLGDTWAPLGRISISLFDEAFGSLPIALDARLSGGVGIERGLIFRDQRTNVQQSFGELAAVVRFAPRSPVQPLLALGGGAYRVSVEGQAESPYRNHHSRSWSALNSIGAGLRIEPFSGASLVLDATLMDVWSKTIVRFGPENVVQIGAPVALFGATASAVF